MKIIFFPSLSLQAMDTFIRLILIIVGLPVIHGLGAVENIPLYKEGIIFEKMSNVRYEIGEWRFHSTLKLDTLTKEIKVIEVLGKYINDSCNKLDSSFGIDCTQIMNEINYNAKNFGTVKKIIDAQCETDLVRVKRQINFIGHIFKEITGVMDSEDSQRVDNDLLKIRNNEQQLMEQMQRQKVAIDSIFEITNQSIFNVQGKLLNFSHAIDSFNERRSEELIKNQARNHIADLLGEMNLILIHVNKRKTLFLSLMETGSMELTSDLLHPDVFLAELEKASKTLTNGYTFPFQANYKNIMKYYKISKVSTKLEGCEVTVNILVPLVANILFEAYKSTNIPKIENNKLFVVPLEDDVIVKSLNNTTGNTMKYMEYEKCVFVDNFKLCPATHNFENFNTSESCHIQMFMNKTSNSCVFQPLNLKHQLWVQMANKNTWIYAVPNTTNIEILQNNKFSSLEISGVGKLKIVRPCLVISKNMYFYFYSSGLTDFEFENIKIDFSQIPHESNFIDEKIPDTVQHSVWPSINEKTLFDEINNLRSMNSGKMQLMNVELEKHSFSFWKTLLIIIIVIASIWGIVKIYKYLKLKFGGEGDSVVPPRPSAPLRHSEPLQVVFTADPNIDYNGGPKMFLTSNNTVRKQARPVLGQISF